MDDQRAGEHGQHNADAAESCEDRQDRDAQLPLGRGGWREDVVRLQGSSWGGGMVGHGLGVLVTPGDVGTHAADHPGEDAEGDAPIARAPRPVHARRGRADRHRSPRSDVGRSRRAGLVRRTAPTGRPGQPRAPVSCGLRRDPPRPSDGLPGGGVPGHTVLATWRSRVLTGMRRFWGAAATTTREGSEMRAAMSSQKVTTSLHDMRPHAHAQSRHPRPRRRR